MDVRMDVGSEASMSAAAHHGRRRQRIMDIGGSASWTAAAWHGLQKAHASTSINAKTSTGPHRRSPNHYNVALSPTAVAWTSKATVQWHTMQSGALFV